MKQLFMILTMIMLGGQLMAQSGKIYFADGKTLEFSKFRGLSGRHTKAGASSFYEKMYVDYENSLRIVPFDKISFIEINYWSPNCPTCRGNISLFDVTLNIQTKTGVYIKNSKFFLLDYVVVYIRDKLTGEQVNQRIYFGFNGKKNINRIVFY